MPVVTNPYINPDDVGDCPLIHAANHKIGGVDVLLPADIGASAANHTHSISVLGGVSAADSRVIYAIPADTAVFRSVKDTNGVYTVITWKRQDNTVYATSTLSGGTSPAYTTRTLRFYAANGTMLLKTIVYTLAYDADGDLLSETVSSVV